MANVYTHGTWTVDPKSEDELVRRWLRLGAWTSERFNVQGGVLLRDCDDPSYFVSTVPWDNFAVIAERRASPEFQTQVKSLMEVVASHEARALDVVARW